MHAVFFPRILVDCLLSLVATPWLFCVHSCSHGVIVVAPSFGPGVGCYQWQVDPTTRVRPLKGREKYVLAQLIWTSVQACHGLVRFATIVKRGMHAVSTGIMPPLEIISLLAQFSLRW